MAEVTASASRTIEAGYESVYAAVVDYAGTRRTMLTEHFSAYEVVTGGAGAGSEVRWKLQATKKRVRDCLVEVTEPSTGVLVEKDRNSSMTTTWTLRADGENRTEVHVESRWTGAGGIGGFFERMFAPGGLRRIYDALLANLAGAVNG